MVANNNQIGGDHYKAKIQVWDFILANDLGYLEGNIIKYITRYRKKNGVMDLGKALHYLEKLIEVENDRLQRTLDPKGQTKQADARGSQEERPYHGLRFVCDADERNDAVRDESLREKARAGIPTALRDII